MSAGRRIFTNAVWDFFVTCSICAWIRLPLYDLSIHVFCAHSRLGRTIYSVHNVSAGSIYNYLSRLSVLPEHITSRVYSHSYTAVTTLIHMHISMCVMYIYVSIYNLDRVLPRSVHRTRIVAFSLHPQYKFRAHFPVGRVPMFVSSLSFLVSGFTNAHRARPPGFLQRPVLLFVRKHPVCELVDSLQYSAT